MGEDVNDEDIRDMMLGAGLQNFDHITKSEFIKMMSQWIKQSKIK